MPIRVLHIVGIMNMGGIENLLMNVYRSIDKEKVQFDFLVTREEQGIFDEEIKLLGGKIYNIPTMASVGYQRYKNIVYKFFKDHAEYRVIHCHRDALCSIYLKQAKRAKIPTRIAHSHTTRVIAPNTIKGKMNILVKNYFKVFSRRYATDYFACGKEAGRWLFGKEIANKELKIINNGLDLDKYKYASQLAEEVREGLGIKKDTFLMGHIGSFTLPKNHEFLIEVFKDIRQSIENSKLLLVGSGELEDKIRHKVIKLGIEKDVIFLGIRKDVNKLLMAMDVFVFPSIFEGLPVSLIEAQATGINCVISNNITQEVDLQTGLISYADIDSKREWVFKLLDINNKIINIRDKRKSPLRQIQDKGYDIATTIKLLESVYLR